MGQLVARWCVVTAMAAVLALPPVAHAEQPPDATTAAATDVAADAATLTGTVNPRGSETTYRFRYGTTTLDLETPAASAGSGGDAVPVTARVTGLAPDTTYRFELVASSPRHERAGGELTFRTAVAPATPPATTTPTTPPALVPLTPADPGGVFGEPPPVFGERVNVTVRRGTVSVSTGGSGFVRINGFASVPVGSMINAREASVSVTTALPGGARIVRTQTGIFHGGLFDVLQPKTEGGMTEMRIRGRPIGCSESIVARTSVEADRRRPTRRLWGNVRGGNFRIRGGNSVASVRGTAWYVEDRCDGTLTRVSQGSVRVRDLRRGRTLVVRAGQSYLARIRR